MIYLATPYTDPDPAVMEERFNRACEIAGRLMAQGLIVFSPVAHTHPIAVRCGLPRGFDYWERYDRALLAAASKLLVAKLPGWERSAGIAAEIKIAEELGIPIEYLGLETLRDWRREKELIEEEGDSKVPND